MCWTGSTKSRDRGSAMNKQDEYRERLKEQIGEHFEKQKKRAKQNKHNGQRGTLNSRLDDDIARQTRLDDVVRDCDFDPESTSFRIS